MGDTTADSREGSEFGPYRLRRLVGRGGMGDVYEAEDTVRERIVALKLMSPTLSRDPVFRSRMQREARTAGRLQEPHVVPIHDFGEIDGRLYVDMRLIDGVDVATMLSRWRGCRPRSRAGRPAVLRRRRPRWRPTRRRRAQAGPRRRLPGHQLVRADRYPSRPDEVALLLGARVIRALGNRRGDNRRGAVASPGSG
jgi:hypothetical protein